MIRRCYKSSILHVNDPSSAGQIRVVVFGASSQVAPSLATLFGRISAQVTFPTRTSTKWVDHLKPAASYRDLAFKQYIDFKDPGIFDKLLENNNVVVNLTGAHAYLRDYDLLYEANVAIAKRIAEAAARNPEILRLIHFSAVGADPQSPSTRLSTKWLGEQEVKAAFPNATILRPTAIFGEFDFFTLKLAQLHQMLGFVPVIDDAAELRQPLYCHDLGYCVMNALKLPESAGQTYELGGPHVYSHKEICEIIFNKIGKPPNLRSIPYSKAHKFFQWMPHFQGLNRFMNLNEVQESRVDLTVAEAALKIEDLYVKPVAFSQNLTRFLQDYQTKVGLTTDELEHGWYGGHDRHYEP